MVIRKNSKSSKGNPTLPLFMGINIIILIRLSGNVLLLAVSVCMFVAILNAAEMAEVTHYISEGFIVTM